MWSRKGTRLPDAEMPNVCGIGLGSEGWTNIVAFLRFNSSMRGSRAHVPQIYPVEVAEKSHSVEFELVEAVLVAIASETG